MKKRIRKSIGILLVVVMLAALAPMTVMAYTDDDPAAEPATRAEVLTLIWRAAGSPAQTGDSPFSDVEEGASYHDAVVWAFGRRMTGDIAAEETFNPESPITLQELIVLLWRHINSPTVRARDWADFPNVEEIAYWALAAMEWALANNIIGSDGTYDPTGYLTLEQAKLIIERAEELRPRGGGGGRRRAAPWRVIDVNNIDDLLDALAAGYNIINFTGEHRIEHGDVVIKPGTTLIVLGELYISHGVSLLQHGFLYNHGVIMVDAGASLTIVATDDDNGFLFNYGSITVDGELTVGSGNWGDLIVRSGGDLTVRSGGELTVGNHGALVVDNDGELTVNADGKITVDGWLGVGNGGEVVLNDPGKIIVKDGGGIGNWGTISGNGSIDLYANANTYGNKPGVTLTGPGMNNEWIDD